MQALPLTLIAFIFVLGVLVFVHEFGHYAVAKLFKVRVEVFSLGFGKRLIGFRRGDTDYRISLLPLGGYVKMAGENPLEARSGDPGEFMSHPRWQRFLIAIAGPAMNIILAVVVLTGLYMYRHNYPAYFDRPAEIGWVKAGSPAQTAGMKRGDRISKVQDKSNPTWNDVRDQTLGRINHNLEMDVQRGGEQFHVSVPVKLSEKEDEDLWSEMGMSPAEPTVIGRVEGGSPADAAGLQPGDEIVGLNGLSLKNAALSGLFEVLQGTKDQPVKLSVVRDGATKELTVTPKWTPSGDEPPAWRIGVTLPPEYHIEKLRFPAALRVAAVDCRKNSTFIFKLLKDLVTGNGSMKQFGGPVMIAKESGRAAKAGFYALLTLLVIISLNLAIFNLLPVPILDGGLMLMLLVEGIMRRDIKQEIKERVYQAAFVFLVLFAAVVIYNDVSKTLPSRTSSSQSK
jgi:regulator of sigma E protease